MCSSEWKRSPSHVPRCHLSVMTHPCNLPSNSEHHHCPKWQEQPSMLTSLEPLLRRFAIIRATRHLFRMSVACSTIHRNTGEWTEVGLPTRLERSKRSTLVTSSTDLIPPSMDPFDCESTGECPNSVPRDPQFATSFNTITIAGS